MSSGYGRKKAVSIMRRSLGILTAALLVLCGCSRTESGTDMSIPETLPPIAEPVLMYYVTDHATASVDMVSQFQAQLESKGYVFRADALSALSADADAVILNAPREDITAEEKRQLDAYMQTGGHLLLLMPADESETRYKYIERFLEHYSIRMDYDLLTETDKGRMSGDAPEFLQIDQIHAPMGMTISEETAQRPLYMNHARSFHFVVQENYSFLRQDAMLKSALTTVGTPCGGGFDDPEVLENETLTTMLYSRDTEQNNAFVVCVGASDFLLDANYDAQTSRSAQDYVYAALDWAAHPGGF